MPKESGESILVVEDTESLREVLCTVLRCEGYEVSPAATAEEGLAIFKDKDFSMVLSDLKLPSGSGLDFLKESKVVNNTVPVVVMTAYGNIDVAVQAMKLGATDFITKPFDPVMLCNLIQQVIKHRRIVDRHHRKSKRKFITQSPAVDSMLESARRVAALSTPVLITGESGTGKELVARHIHDLSPRSNSEFVAVNCASMPSELLESEFFGHEAGSFTGATERRFGLFEVASGGTIFLDEIGNMPHELQVKLLRTLQESEVKRIGSNTIQKIDCRVISATNCDIEAEVKSGVFRDDLYYRLGVVVIDIPPLRERKGDISLLARYFLKSFCADLNEEEPKVITAEAMSLLESYSWPGNVRELENAIERAVIFSEREITPEYFQLGASDSNNDGFKGKSLPEIAAIALKEAEIETILRTLTETKGNKSKASKILGVSYKTLLNKIKDYEIGDTDFS